ncbi:MAG: AraC family transcriptional regulator [Bacteroidaceae bacterium]|nr:AraC family transcriptional regulator [Bacteroidaceae bacterium]
MRKQVELKNFTLEKLLEMEVDSHTSARSVVYEQNTIVVHNLKTSGEDDVNAFSLYYPTRMNIILLLLCLKGDAEVQCDLQRCRISDNTLFICKPGTILQALGGHVEEISAVFMDMSMMERLNISLQKLLPYYSSLEKLTAIPLRESECLRFNMMIGFLRDTIASSSQQLYYHETVNAQMIALSYEFLSIFSQNIIQEEKRDSYSTRREDYFRQFINLLGLHFREQRRISYYASQLNITPKYLGTIVMQTTGRPASAWVNEYVMAEARTLLRNSSLSIQEIAYALNFPNQSFFGKYFKAHSGVSPSAFRK